MNESNRWNMKKFLYILAAVLLLASCEKDPFEEFLAKKSYGSRTDMIWDFAPLTLAFEVTDGQGNNLFDESTPGNWLDTPILATFDGQEFSGPVSAPWLETKAYLAILRGLYLVPNWYTESDDDVLLMFGELDSTKKWDADLHIYWPDRSQDIIRIQHAFRWDITGDPEQFTAIKVNGKPLQERIIRLTK